MLPRGTLFSDTLKRRAEAAAESRRITCVRRAERGTETWRTSLGTALFRSSETAPFSRCRRPC